MKKLRVAVIGCGNLGQHHIRIYNSLKDVNLLYIVDTDEQKLEKFKKNYPHIQTTKNFNDIFGKVEAVSLVVPTFLHYEIGKEVLKHNIHLLVEKPITSKLEEAEELITLAKDRNLILQVGHVERFNPIIQKTKDFIKNPQFIETWRLGNFDPRVADIGVVLDLMIHDIDIILLYLDTTKIKQIESFGAKVFSEKEDIVKTRMYFENGCICDLTASRISPVKYRKMHIFQHDSYISIDFIRQSAKIYKKSIQELEFTRVKVQKDEPLKIEIEHFVNSILTNRKPLVGGEHGKNALSVALEILKNLKLK